jgi:hypothetical protein
MTAPDSLVKTSHKFTLLNERHPDMTMPFGCVNSDYSRDRSCIACLEVLVAAFVSKAPCGDRFKDVLPDYMRPDDREQHLGDQKKFIYYAVR